MLNCRRQVEESKVEAEKDGVKVPETVEEYCVKNAAPKKPDEDMLDYEASAGLICYRQ